MFGGCAAAISGVAWEVVSAGSNAIHGGGQCCGQENSIIAADFSTASERARSRCRASRQVPSRITLCPELRLQIRCVQHGVVDGIDFLTGVETFA